LRDSVVNAYLPHSSSSRGWKQGDPKEAPGDETPPGLSPQPRQHHFHRGQTRSEASRRPWWSESSAASSRQLPRDLLAQPKSQPPQSQAMPPPTVIPPRRKVPNRTRSPSLEWQLQERGTKSQRRASMQGRRMWCHVLLHKHFGEFELVEMLTGEEGLPKQWGNHTIRVRGKGSNQYYYDSSGSSRVYGWGREEAIPLMVAIVTLANGLGEVSEANPEHFRKAVEVTIAKVKEIWEPFARERPWTHNERPWQFGEMSSGAEKVLAALIHEDLSGQCRCLGLPPPLMPMGEQDTSMAAAATTAGV
jgi:hypothetical protein